MVQLSALYPLQTIMCTVPGSNHKSCIWTSARVYDCFYCTLNLSTTKCGDTEDASCRGIGMDSLSFQLLSHHQVLNYLCFKSWPSWKLSPPPCFNTGTTLGLRGLSATIARNLSSISRSDLSTEIKIILDSNA